MDKGKRFVCPLLKNVDSYNPDTIDLLNNDLERNYWLPCLERMVKGFVQRAESLNPDNPLATQKANECYQKFHKLVEELNEDPTLLKPLSVRTLLEFNEDNLRANDFQDAWRTQKQKETNCALIELESRLNVINSISNFRERWLELMKGVLAGNVFDWGSRAIADILENSDKFGLSNALNTIEQRPWFHDDLDVWIGRLEKKPYKLAVIFVDNAGVDFVLGILPMVREFLKQNTRIVLTANTSPALNDVTYNELNLYCCEAAEHCEILRDAINDGRLMTVANGQKGPCLDLSDLSEELFILMDQADLIILEGMGRAVHTNLFAKFNVDSIKMAVIKNEWLANSLGAKQFSVIFKYETTVTITNST